MKTGVRILVLALIVGGGGAGVWYWKFRPPEQLSNNLTLFGNVDVRQVDVRQVDLAINGGERIGRVLAEEGDRVEPGQLLAELELE